MKDEYTITLPADQMQAVINGLSELPAKFSRAALNNIEQQIVAQNRPQAVPDKPDESDAA